jgi:Domain of unknown function (DUF4157)
MKDSVRVSRKKTGLSNTTNPSLISPDIPTLASPIRSFTPQINTSAIQTVPEVPSQTQFTDEQVLELEALKQRPLGHDISRISLRPQAKLSVSKPGDRYEQEADMMANRVMSMPLPTLQREPMLEEEEEVQPLAFNASIQRKILLEVQTKRWDALPVQCATDGSFQAGGNIESQLNSSKGGGSPLGGDVRGFMEPRFGADFAGVRVHTGGDAVQMNRKLGAQAFAHGSDIYFGAGKSPGNNELTAHELTHVIQQGGSKSVQRQAEPKLAQPDNGHEKMLDQAINIVQQSLNAINSQSSNESNSDQTEAFPDDRAQEEGLQTVMQKLAALRGSNSVDEIQAATQPILAAAKGNFAAVNLTSDEQANETESSYTSIPSIQRFVPLVPALAGAGAGVAAGEGAAVLGVLSGPVGWAILGTVAVAGLGYAGYQAYQASRSRTQERTRVEPRVIPREKEETPSTMRFQVQWGTNAGGPTFSQVATAPSSTGVTTVQAVAALEATVYSVIPTKAKEAAEPARVKQIQWILNRPPTGVATAGYSKSEYFSYKGYTDARVDVENLRGHNLRA